MKVRNNFNLSVSFFVILLFSVIFVACSSEKEIAATNTKTSADEMVAPDTVDTINPPEEIILNSATTETAQIANGSASLHKHVLWDKLVSKYVNTSGFVNYKGFISDSVLLNKYLDILSNNAPEESWTKEQKMAFWINAYNAFTVKLIVDNYPVKSIKELGGSIYKINTPWDIKFIKIGENTYDLNNIEHGILRKDFPDARIHAVVNCASFSCPALLNKAFTADKLEEQLTAQMKYFVNDASKNTITAKGAELSSLFKMV
jgi:Protein of unknown function, DUF547.